MQNNIFNYILIILTIITSYVNAQVIATGDTVLCDGQQGNVEVNLSATSFAVDLTDSNIYTDDTFGSAIDMGFNFVFYGNSYSQVVLASNNYLSFNTANAGGYSDWTIDAAIPTNLEPETQNSILCPWQDIYPGVNGNGIIAYATTGEAPNRVFIASFCGIPMFSCTEICYSSQIKLYESSNIIETHIAQKVLCTTWNSGYAIHGLHNIDGTIAHIVTGLDGIERNFPNQWTCENDGWRFTPNGDDDYIIENIEFAPSVAGTDIIWQDQFGNQIGTGSEITVIPGGDVTYTAGASLCGDAGDWCGFEGGIEGDDVIISFEELSIISNGNNVTCYAENNGSIEVMAPGTGNWLYNLYSNNNLIESQLSNNDSFLFENLSPGDYSVTIEESSSTCISEELFITINEPSEINSSSIINNISCFNENDGSINIEINGGTPPYNTYIGSIENPAEQYEIGSNITFTNLGAGNYFYTTIDDNGCLIPGDEIFFTIEEPTELIITIDDTGDVTCEEAANGFIDITISGGSPTYQCNWTSPNGFNSTSTDVDNLNGGTYTVSVLDENGCFNSVNIEIDANTGMNINGNTTDCIDENGIIEVNVNGGTPNYSYNLILDNEIIDNNNSGIFTNLTNGNYTVLVTDNYLCEIEENFTLNAAPFADFSIENNEYEFYLSNTPTQFIDLSIDENISSWIWEFGDGSTSNDQNPAHLYINPGTYFTTLTITDIYNCESIITKEINILQDFYSYTPNIFTPNNDGLNDTFTPSLLNININTYSLFVYDRWGNVIFETNDYNKGWDGKLKNGTMLPPDVYSYKIMYQTNLGVEKKELGRVTMAR